MSFRGKIERIRVLFWVGEDMTDLKNTPVKS